MYNGVKLERLSSWTHISNPYYSVTHVVFIA